MQYLGLRGICYIQLEVTSLSQDVHSGLGGSIFPNAAWRLIWALQSLKDVNEKIKIPGFYDDVVEPSEAEIGYFEKLPDMEREYKRQYGIEDFLKGIKGGTKLRIEQVFKPTCTICGLTSGYQGEGSKTILPSFASAKIDFRLVPDQRPVKVLELLRIHLDNNGFEDIKIIDLGGEPPSKTDPNDPFVKIAVDSAVDVYRQPMQIVPMSGGSGPNYIVQESLNIPIISMGVGYPGSGAHSPNENIRIEDYLKAAKHLTRFILKIGMS
jgi:acetylornithine deacetylase/succinyl-diaminopimelate desuccinylase-like protein